MELHGVFRNYVYEPDDNSGYAILRVRIAPGEYVICEPNGCVPPRGLTLGVNLCLTGEYRPGRRIYFPYDGEPSFVFTSATIVMPNDVESAVEYIENLGIRGIANANARHIVDITGPDVEGYFRNNPDVADFKSKIPTITNAAAAALIRRVMTTTTQHQLEKYAKAYGLTHNDADKMYQCIVREVGRECTFDEVIDILKPKRMGVNAQIGHGLYYYCARSDVPFDTADSFGEKLGYRAYHPERLLSLVFQAMQQFENQGHVWSNLDTLYEACCKLTKKMAFPDVVISKWALYAAVRMGRGFFREERNGERIYLESSWFDERSIVSNVRRIQATSKVLPYYNSIISDIENERGVSFSAAQRECFEFLRNSGVHIVTGGAGTGKTTVISGLLTAYTRLNPDCEVALCAPTGRAAQRMTELCATYGSNVRAYTIHKLLDFAPFGGEAAPSFNEKNPLAADMLIVDEMSMVDMHLFALLTKAIKDGALVILCGDVSQLPSVAAGRVFWDLIESQQFHVVRLTANYRQANAGGANNIIENANRINAGKWVLQRGADFDVIVCHDDLEAQDTVVQLMRRNPLQTVLTTVRKDAGGVDELNKVLQPIVNTSCGGSIQYGSVKFRENDHIIMTRNDYSVGYVNGDVGVITSVSNGQMTIQFGDEERVIEHANYKDVSLAYAMTIHKSQGSEYDSVIVVLPSRAPGMLARNLLYTAVTRAKKHITLVISDEATIRKAVRNTRNACRRTTLKDLLTR